MTTTADPPVFQKAPPLDPAWLAHEREAGFLAPKPILDPIEKESLYAAESRQRNAAMMAAGARDYHLSLGITTQYLHVDGSAWKGSEERPSIDAKPIILQYDRETDVGTTPEWVVVYYHGGGLLVGEADSEDLSCRRILKDTEGSLPKLRLYSVGYRLKPQHPAGICVSDSLEAFSFIEHAHLGAKIIVVGSSSGGELAALVTQQVPKDMINGVLLRCPVTSDAFRGKEYVPKKFRDVHTSASDTSFQNSLLMRLDMNGPRDGLLRLPLEAREKDVIGMPRTWIQLCTNDGLYSDGACYAMLLREAGVEVKSDVVYGWPHTFWLKAPQLARALEADKAMIRGLKWVAGLEED